MLEAYDARWGVEFAALREVYVEALEALILRVEHVGSTAVPGLRAKPILDIDIVISGYEVFPQVVVGLERLGYAHNGNQGIPEREAFKPADELTPRVLPSRKWMTHHLYVCPEGSRELRRHVAFRDALRGSEDLRVAYETLKMEIAGKAGGDRKVYARIKEEACREFVERVVGG